MTSSRKISPYRARAHLQNEISSCCISIVAKMKMQVNVTLGEAREQT
jgi:hypothetical protein